MSNDARLLQREAGLTEPDPDGVADAEMAGFVTGANTLFRGLRQLEAGGLALWRAGSGAPEVTRYRVYLPDAPDARPESEMAGDMMARLDAAIERTMVQAGGRPIWVPLSAGLDSRLLLAKFVEHGYDNLRAFTYGPLGNDEMRAARVIADRLEVPWTFHPSRPADMRSFFSSGELQAYWDYCDGLSAVPNFQDLLTLHDLDRRGTLPEDAVVVNGQTGDFISGGHIPAALMTDEPGADGLFNAIVAKHFSLWTSLKTPERLEDVRARTFERLGVTPDPRMDRETAIAHYERFEYEERQAKYVINGQRNYGYLGRDWALPLWDSGFVEFWRNVPVARKYRQQLFRDALARWDYRGLFRDFQPRVDQWSGLTKAILVPSRLIRLTLGREARDRFLRRMLYFGMYHDQYAPFGYGRFLKAAGDLRNPVSLLSREWLARQGLSAERG